MVKKELFIEVKRERGFLAHLLIYGGVTTSFSLCIAFFFASAVDVVYMGISDFHEFLRFPLILAVLIGMRALAIYYFGTAFREYGLSIKDRILKDHMNYLLDQGPVFHQSKNTGGDSAGVCEAADYMEPFYHEYLPALFQLAMAIPVILLVTFYLDFISGIIMLLTGPFLPFFLYLIGKESQKSNQERMKSLNRLGGSLFDTINGMRTIKLFGLSKRYQKKINDTSNEFRKETMKVLRISFLSAFVLELAATISTAMIAVTLGFRLMENHIEFFSCFFILLLTPDYFQAIRKFGAKFHVAQNAGAAYEMIDLLVQPADCQAETIDFDTAAFLKPTVSFENVSFSYEGGKQVLRDINLKLEPGTITALVGKSGAGKTTITYCLLKYLLLDRGTIRINDVDYSQISGEALRRQIGYIPQRPYVFTDTLRNNLIMGNPDASDQEVKQAVQAACLEPLIESLPMGLSTMVSDLGQNFSVGERQRIAIARAIIKDAPIVVIDEAVSAQDLENEQLLTKSFQNLSREKTVLLIGHRLETVKSATTICLIDDGVLTEMGTHEELMACDGAYKKLVCTWE